MHVTYIWDNYLNSAAFFHAPVPMRTKSNSILSLALKIKKEN